LGRREPVLDLVTIGCDEETTEEGRVETRSNEDGGGIFMAVGTEMIGEVMGEAATSGSPGVESDGIGIWMVVGTEMLGEVTGEADASGSPGAESEGWAGEMGTDIEILGGKTADIIGREGLIKKGESPATWSLDGS
jgi:hypothetical protein